jgi:hypothetical protein
VLFLRLLAKEQDYAFALLAMTRNKIRRLELLTGAPTQKGRNGVAGGKSKAVFEAERELSRQAETGYQRLVTDWHSWAKRISQLFTQLAIALCAPISWPLM